uniref:Secreted protein n=1 Tax=Glycine max TaxID=3847 RepID=C6T1S7_SOYBN|nr:unknown [Glycine max]
MLMSLLIRRLLRVIISFCSLNNVDSTVSVHNVTNFTNFKSKSCFFKRLLHLATTKRTEITPALGGAAIGEARGDVLEGGLARNDVVAEGLELRNRVFSGCALDDATFRILPRGLPSRTFVLYQYVRSPNLNTATTLRRRRRHLRLLMLIPVLLLRR